MLRTASPPPPAEAPGPTEKGHSVPHNRPRLLGSQAKRRREAPCVSRFAWRFRSGRVTRSGLAALRLEAHHVAVSSSLAYVTRLWRAGRTCLHRPGGVPPSVIRRREAAYP